MPTSRCSLRSSWKYSWSSLRCYCPLLLFTTAHRDSSSVLKVLLTQFSEKAVNFNPLVKEKEKNLFKLPNHVLRQTTRPRSTPAVDSAAGSSQASGGWDTSNCHNHWNHKHLPQPSTLQDLHAKAGEQALNFHWFWWGQPTMLHSSEKQTQELVLLRMSRYRPLPKANGILSKAAS